MELLVAIGSLIAFAGVNHFTVMVFSGEKSAIEREVEA
jgi:hypothetical protein